MLRAFKTLVFAIIAIGSFFPPSAWSTSAPCPSSIENLCGSPRVQKLINLQHEIERASAPGRSQDRFEAQIDTLNRMFDIGLIRGVAIYLAERKTSLGRVENAREILGAAVSRSMALFQTLPLVNPSSDGFDVFDLLAHLHRHGEQEAAGRSLDHFLDYVEASVPGYEGGLLLGEGGRLLGEWEKPSAARAAFDRARRFARRQPLRDEMVDYPRFFILIHITQRASEAGFQDLARAALQEAETLRVRGHSGEPDLESVVMGMRGFIESR